uniref:Hypotheticial protein n=1 Tax=Schistosoma japonicum TaxID=6182 RepID=C1LHJ8_SCHJA|nr:hypotheticial protein [Schistosoma japonicum]
MAYDYGGLQNQVDASPNIQLSLSVRKHLSKRIYVFKENTQLLRAEFASFTKFGEGSKLLHIPKCCYLGEII